jgi:hypothetical protein
MLQKIKLIIETGNGNVAIAADSGQIDVVWQPLLDIAFRGQVIGDFNRVPAGDMGKNLNDAIDSLRNDRGSYASLTPAQLGLRPRILEFLTNWREDCREHPATFISIEP